MKDLRIIIKRIIISYKYMKRINKLAKANKILMKEYSEIIEKTCSVDKRFNFINAMKIINTYTGDLLDELKLL